MDAETTTAHLYAWYSAYLYTKEGIQNESEIIKKAGYAGDNIVLVIKDSYSFYIKNCPNFRIHGILLSEEKNGLKMLLEYPFTKVSGFINMAKKDVFISYSHSDEEKVLSFYDKIKENFSVFIDKKNLKPGDILDETLEGHINNSDAILLFLSQASLNSESVSKEIDWAIKHQKTIIPIKIEKCIVPEKLKSILYVNYPKTEDELNELINKIHSVIK